jgi:hypothetical protein
VLRYLTFNTRNQLFANLRILSAINFAHARGTCDIDFGEIVTNDVKADE